MAEPDQRRARPPSRERDANAEIVASEGAGGDAPAAGTPDQRRAVARDDEDLFPDADDDEER